MKKIDVNKSLIFSRNVEDLKNSLDYLYQDGYCSNSEDFSEYEDGVLDGVHASNFMFRPYELTHNGDNEFFSYFIPKNKVVFIEEEPKKYKPFKNISEFSNKTGCTEIGRNVLTMKYKYEKTERVLLYVGYTAKGVCLGGFVLNFETLLDQFEFYRGGKWQPFGIEE